MRQKHNADLEVPKYLKQKESNISKANKKSKHKHQYEECLIRYKWNWEENKIHTSLNSYCIICGKINDRMKNSIVTDYMKKVDTPMGKRIYASQRIRYMKNIIIDYRYFLWRIYVKINTWRCCDLNFRYEDLNKEIFDKVVAFSYSIGSGLGGPGAMIMLTRDGKEYIIGQEGFEGDWLNPAHSGR